MAGARPLLALAASLASLLCLGALHGTAPWLATAARRLEAHEESHAKNHSANEEEPSGPGLPALVPNASLALGLQCPGDEELDDFGRLVGVGRLPPYYFMILAMVTKPMVATAIFGPPAPKPPDDSALGAARRIGKQAVQLALLSMAGLQAFGDVAKMVRVLQASADWWRRLLAVAVIASASTNIQAGFNAFALYDLTKAALAFAQSHGHLEGLSVAGLLGPVGNAYIWILMLLYLPLAALLFLLALPALLAYIYLAAGLALLVMVNWLFFFCFIECLLPRIRGTAGHAALLQEAATEEEATRHLEAMGRVVDRGKALAQYRPEIQAYHATGVPQYAWVGYTLASLLPSPFVFLFVPVACRLYAGRGYLPSLQVTLHERHIATFLGCSATGLVSKVQLLWLWL